MIRSFLALVVACMYVATAFAQQKVLSKAEVLAKSSFSLMNSAPDSAMMLADSGLSLAGASRDANGYAACLNAKGMALYRLGKNDSASRVLQAAVASFESQHNKHDAARSLINLSVLYTDQALYEQGMEAVMKAKTYMESANDTSGKAYAEKMIGILYRQQGNNEQAILSLRSAIHDFAHTGDTSYLADAISTLGNVYCKTGSMDSAFYYYRQALHFYAQISSLNGMAYVNENIGDAYYKLANGRPGSWLDSALNYYKKAFALFEKLNSSQSMAYEKMMIGNALMTQGYTDAARDYFEEALATFDSEKSYVYASQTLEDLRTLEASAGRYKQAYGYASRELVYNDTLASGNRKEVMAAMFAKYEVDKRDRTIALLNTQRKLAMQELHHRRTMEAGYLIFGLIAVCLALILVNHYRVRQQLRSVKIRNQLASDLHDDVGSSLSSILLLSKMALSPAGSEETRSKIITTIQHNAGAVIDRMGDIVWTMNPRFDKSESLFARMEYYVQQVRQGTSLNIRMETAGDVAGTIFSMEVRKNIFLIFKEAVNNALKHSNATDLSIFFGMEHDSLKLRICDNGKGFSTADEHPGMGLGTLKQRAAAMKASLTIERESAGGTCLLLLVPAKSYRSKILRQKSVQ